MDESHIRIVRTARFHSLGRPGPHLREVWLVCHGYGQLAARFLRRFEILADGSRYIVAPEGLNRFYLERDGEDRQVGATWMTREDRLNEIEDYVGYLDTLCGRIFATVERDAVSFTALGFSQGVATVCRWAARAPVPPDRLVMWAGSLPPELIPSPRLFGETRLSVVLGDSDRHVRDGDRRSMLTRFDEAGLAFDLIRFPGGHELDPSALRALAESTGVRT